MTRSPRHCALAVAAIALITFLPASAARAADLLPDLVAPVPTNPAVGVSTLADGHDHLLVRFDGYIHNVGAGALEIFGSNPVNGVMTVSGQRIYTTAGSTRDDTSRHPQIYFENSDGHNHWHLRGAARFSLWNEAGTAEVAAGAKVGFCLEDVDRIDSFASREPLLHRFLREEPARTCRAWSKGSRVDGRTSMPPSCPFSGSISRMSRRAATGPASRSIPTTS